MKRKTAKGPLRKVVGQFSVQDKGWWILKHWEILECGHCQRPRTDCYGEYSAEKRRCGKCLTKTLERANITTSKAREKPMTTEMPFTKNEAMKHLRNMLVGCQKATSIMAENGEMGDRVSAFFNVAPFLVGSKSIIPVLAKFIDAVDAGEKELTPQDFRNFMTIVNAFEYMQMVQVFVVSQGEKELPAPEHFWAVAKTWKAE